MESTPNTQYQIKLDELDQVFIEAPINLNALYDEFKVTHGQFQQHLTKMDQLAKKQELNILSHEKLSTRIADHLNYSITQLDAKLSQQQELPLLMPMGLLCVIMIFFLTGSFWYFRRSLKIQQQQLKAQFEQTLSFSIERLVQSTVISVLQQRNLEKEVAGWMQDMQKDTSTSSNVSSKKEPRFTETETN